MYKSVIKNYDHIHLLFLENINVSNIEQNESFNELSFHSTYNKNICEVLKCNSKDSTDVTFEIINLVITFKCCSKHLAI